MHTEHGEVEVRVKSRTKRKRERERREETQQLVDHGVKGRKLTWPGEIYQQRLNPPLQKVVQKRVWWFIYVQNRHPKKEGRRERETEIERRARSRLFGLVRFPALRF